MEDLLLDLGEERRRGSATYVRTDAGVSGPGSGGWGGASPRPRLPEAPQRGLARAAGAGGPGVAPGRGRRGGGLVRPAPGAAGGSAAAAWALPSVNPQQVKNRSQPRGPLRLVGSFPASLRFLEPQGRAPLESTVLRVAGRPRPGSHWQPS